MLDITPQKLARILGGDVSGHGVIAPGPDHSREDRSLSIKITKANPDGFVVHSHSPNDNDLACKDWVREKLKQAGYDTPNGHAQSNGHTRHRTLVATYDYTDETGTLLFHGVRYKTSDNPKNFTQRRPDGSGGWIYKLDDVLYRLPELIEAVANNHPIFICEGEKAVGAVVKLGVPATCSPHGAGKWRENYSKHLAGADIAILPDHDIPGAQHCALVAKSLTGVAAKVRVLHLPGIPQCGDAYDWVQSGGTAEKLWALVETEATEWPLQAEPEASEADTAKRRLQPVCIHQLLKLEIPTREMILDPIIPEKGLAMLYASRGIGKTHVACGIANAVATGTKFLKWDAPKPRKVLHVDGELPAVELRERFAQVMAGATIKPEPSMLQILTADLIELGIGNLAAPKVQAELEPWLDSVELLVLDNLSSLTSVIRDDDTESWNPIQEWLLRLRRRGVSVLIVHHAGKGGEQRGTSRREDVLDTSISLRRPSDYVAPEGARFEVHFEKARGIHGNRAKPFEAMLEVRDDATLSTIREIEDVNLARVKALLDDELTIRDIADETGLSKSAVHRLKKQFEAMEAAAEGVSRGDH
jgi:hypothetical protein